MVKKNNHTNKKEKFLKLLLDFMSYCTVSPIFRLFLKQNSRQKIAKAK